MAWGAIYESKKYIFLSTDKFHKIIFNFLSVCFWNFNEDKALIITKNSIVNTKTVSL